MVLKTGGIIDRLTVWVDDSSWTQADRDGKETFIQLMGVYFMLLNPHGLPEDMLTPGVTVKSYRNDRTLGDIGLMGGVNILE